MESIHFRDNYIVEKNEGIIKVFSRMFWGLLVTALTAFYTYKSGLYLSVLSGMSYAVLAIIEVVVVLMFSFMFRKLSPTAVSVLYFIYAIVNGITMSVIFAAFSLSTIFYAFLTASLLFGGLALYGKTTNRDISNIGTICTVALIVGFVISLINLFVGNPFINTILDWIMLLVFCGLTAYDMNKITNMQNYVEFNTDNLYVYGAMELYLDFINIFIRLLSIFARNDRRNN